LKFLPNFERFEAWSFIASSSKPAPKSKKQQKLTVRRVKTVHALPIFSRKTENRAGGDEAAGQAVFV
jgi:hypothetical protein